MSLKVYKKIDIVFISIPKLNLQTPITAPAILKSVVENYGYNAKCYDFNLDLWLNVDLSKYGKLWTNTNLDFRYTKKFETLWNNMLKEHAVRWANIIKRDSPKYIGITIFSARSKHLILKLCELFSELLPNIKIIVGGAYTEFIGAKLLKMGIIHSYVIGEGEEAIINILKGKLNFPGINGIPPKQIKKVEKIPIPNYTDFEMNKYPKNWKNPFYRGEGGTEYLNITASRGCVRRCSFCDIGHKWPHFKSRSGFSIVKEMKEQYKKHNISNFIFTDSLINGNIKQLDSMCNEIKKATQNNCIKNIRWEAQFAAFSEKIVPEYIYKLISESGVDCLYIGVESGSEKVRNDMNKNCNDEALDFTFRMCAKYNIKMIWLILIGYVTETEDDFNLTLQLFEKYNWINKLGLIKSVSLGPTLEIVEGSPLYDSIEKYNISWDKCNNWVYQNNNKEIRILRWLKCKDLCTKLKYPIEEKNTEHLLEELKKYKGNKCTKN